MTRHVARLLIVSLVLTACGPVPTPPPTGAPIAAKTVTPLVMPTTSPDNDLNLLVVSSGEVRLKRDGWPDYHRTAFGAIPHRGDLLRLDDEARAVVLCADLTAWSVPTGTASGVVNGCPPSEQPDLIRAGSKIGSTKAPVDPLVPYIISPRSTRLMSTQPKLRWNATTGATTYTVGIDPIGWVAETTATELIYPASAPPLQPGVDYLLWVRADNGRSSQEENLPGLGFRLLESSEMEKVKASTARLQGLALDPQGTAYALAYLSAGCGLVSEAVDLLEGLVLTGCQEAAVYRTLGDLYRSIGLTRLAEERYLKASELAAHAGDVEGCAAALASLGEVYAGWSNTAEAVRYWQQALECYRDIGDAAQVSRVQSRMIDIK